MEHQYSFSTWSRDILIWSIATDGDASRKAASVISQLQGSAREFSRTLPPQTILTGGTVNGTQTDPLTFLMYQLSTRFARLGEEVRLGAVGDLLSFGRESNERIDMLLTRFDTTRMRAAETGGLALSYAGLSWLLIRAVGVSDSQLIQLLQPLGGALPADEQQFTGLKDSIRRMGRIIENAPGNMSNMLRGRQTPTHSYHIQDEHSWNENVFTSQNDQPSSSWHDQSSWQSQWHSSEAYPTYTQPQDPYVYLSEGQGDSGTDTDTSSDYGEEAWPAAEGATANEQAAELYWAYSRAKARWRSFMGKPTRKARRFARRAIYKGGKGGKNKHGKPKGKIINTSSYLSELNESQLMEIFPAFRAKGGKKGAGSGKGKGRKGNPRGPDGRKMRCHECGSEDHLVAKCPRRAAANDSSQNLFVDLDTADQIPPGVITSTTVLMVSEVDANVGQESGTDHWSTVSGGPPSNASTLPAAPQDPWANSDPWRRYNESRTGRQVVGGIVNPMPPLPRTTRAVDMADQSLYMQSVFNGLNGLMHPTTEPRSFGPPVMNQFTHNTPLATNPTNNLPQNNPTNPQGRNVNNEPFSQQPVAESTTIQEPYVAQNMQPPPMQLPPVQRHEVSQHPLIVGPGEIPTVILQHPAPELPEWALMPEFNFLQGTASEVRAPTYHPIVSENAISTLDTIRSQVVGEFHQANQLREIPIASRVSERVSEPAFNHPQVRALHHQHRTMMTLQEMRTRESEGSRSEVNPAHTVTPSNNPTEPMVTPNVGQPNAEYLGDEHRCSICLEEYNAGEQLVRLTCRHTYHEGCWTDILLREENPTCPCCRGGGHVVAHYRYIAPTSPREQQDEFRTPHGTPTFPWWPETSELSGATSTYHSSTQVPGHQSIVVDPGAWTNLAGQQWAERQATAARNAGLRSTRKSMTNPMAVRGVGQGTQSCTHVATLPIAIPNIIHPRSQPEEGDGPLVRGESVSFNFETPMVEGEGRDLPALLGLRSMSNHNAVLEMAPGREMLTLTATGSYTISWGSDAIHIPLERAPSGHLVFRTDAFQSIPRRGGGLPPTVYGLYSHMNRQYQETPDVPIGVAPSDNPYADVPETPAEAPARSSTEAPARSATRTGQPSPGSPSTTPSPASPPPLPRTGQPSSEPHPAPRPTPTPAPPSPIPKAEPPSAEPAQPSMPTPTESTAFPPAPPPEATVAAVPTYLTPQATVMTATTESDTAKATTPIKAMPAKLGEPAAAAPTTTMSTPTQPAKAATPTIATTAPAKPPTPTPSRPPHPIPAMPSQHHPPPAKPAATATPEQSTPARPPAPTPSSQPKLPMAKAPGPINRPRSPTEAETGAVPTRSEPSRTTTTTPGPKATAERTWRGAGKAATPHSQPAPEAKESAPKPSTPATRTRRATDTATATTATASHTSPRIAPSKSPSPVRSPSSGTDVAAKAKALRRVPRPVPKGPPRGSVGATVTGATPASKAPPPKAPEPGVTMSVGIEGISMPVEVPTPTVPINLAGPPRTIPPRPGAPNESGTMLKEPPAEPSSSMRAPVTPPKEPPGPPPMQPKEPPGPPPGWTPETSDHPPKAKARVRIGWGEGEVRMTSEVRSMRPRGRDQ